ncbi:MAG: glycosyltransferase family 8 protein, partial [Cyanobacteria bacterium]|nr:glycosyltransferase family 8 protein [Cyanobacteriota bacterium]
NPDEDLSVYIVHEALDPKERAKLVGYLGEFLPSVSLLQVEPRLLSHFPVSGHVSIATYFRLLLPSILPPILNRALFIDSDVVINGSLRELWETPFEGHSLAAVTDRNLDIQRERLEMDADSPYFNAGMMLIDLEAWRRANVLERGMAYAIENRDKLNNWDQDVLNHLFEKRVLLLHQRWNAMSHLWGLDQAWMDERGGLLNPEEQQAHDGPAIIHFAGGGRAKPWDYRCNNPWKDRYRQFLAQSPWAGVPLDGQPEEISSNLVRRALAKASRTIRGTH